MLKFNNSHIFTGFLKQFLSSFNLPTCRIYTSENKQYLDLTGKEADRVIESISTTTINAETGTEHINSYINIPYLKDGNLYIYSWENSDKLPEDEEPRYVWKPCKNFNYRAGVAIPGLTKTLYDPGSLYTATTHEYLGDFLRFYRDSTNINLMPLYNCFSNNICNNINTTVLKKDLAYPEILFNAANSQYKIYAIPVKLFEDYTIAIDCAHGVEMFCGLYRNNLDLSKKGIDLIRRTYHKENQAVFNKPFLYSKLNVSYWGRAVEATSKQKEIAHKFNTKTARALSKKSADATVTRWDIINRECDLKLFIKIPTSNTSSITILEGNYLNFNDCLYIPPTRSRVANKKYSWEYYQNTFKGNFKKTDRSNSDHLPPLNERPFRPIGKLQLLALNTGVSYPFSDRLIEYLSGNVITPEDGIADNIERVQKVMEKNGYLFDIPGVWEPSMQKIVYDYIKNDGPISIRSDSDGKYLHNEYRGLHNQLGHNSRSSYFDVLGFVDKDAEKFYASWKVEGIKTEKPEVVPSSTIQNIDIYPDLYKSDK